MTCVFLLLLTLVCIAAGVFYFAAGQVPTAMLSLFLAFGLALMGLLTD